MKRKSHKAYLDGPAEISIPTTYTYILLKSFNKAIKGELQGWGTLKRTGRVKEVATAN
ncbi:MAG: hypothetical protein ABI683_02210 [Ginsengibacter sp.]